MGLSLPEFINEYADTYILFDGFPKDAGQCVQLVELYMVEVQAVDPPRYPNAKDYWFQGIPGYSQVSTPEPGDIAVYNAHGAFPEGHIAVCVGNGEVFEQNADPDGSPAHVFTRATTYLLGYLRKDNMNVSPNLNDGDIVNAMKNAGMDPETEANLNYRKTWVAIGNWNKWWYDFYAQPSVIAALQKKYGSGYMSYGGPALFIKS